MAQNALNSSGSELILLTQFSYDITIPLVKKLVVLEIKNPSYRLLQTFSPYNIRDAARSGVTRPEISLDQIFEQIVSDYRLKATRERERERERENDSNLQRVSYTRKLHKPLNVPKSFALC